MGEKNVQKITSNLKLKKKENFIVFMSRFNKVIVIKLAGPPECLAGLSDLWSNLPRLTTWVGRVLLSPVIVETPRPQGLYYHC